MTLPPYMTSTLLNVVYKLTQCLYGLKQASRQCHEKLLTTIVKARFYQASSNHSLFAKVNNQSFITLAIYVDDVILEGNDMSKFQSLKGFLHNKFGIKDIGALKQFLGIEVDQSYKEISIYQRKYCLDLLNDTCMNDEM